MCFLRPSRPLLLTEREIRILRCRQSELWGVLGLLCLMIGCQDGSLIGDILLLRFGRGDSYAHAQKHVHNLHLSMHLRSHMHTRVQSPYCLSGPIPIAHRPWTPRRPTSSPGVLRPGFTQRSLPPFIRHTKRASPFPKCLQLRWYQSRSCFILQDQLWHSATLKCTLKFPVNVFWGPSHMYKADFCMIHPTFFLWLIVL